MNIRPVGGPQSPSPAGLFNKISQWRDKLVTWIRSLGKDSLEAKIEKTKSMFTPSQEPVSIRDAGKNFTKTFPETPATAKKELLVPLNPNKQSLVNLLKNPKNSKLMDEFCSQFAESLSISKNKDPMDLAEAALKNLENLPPKNKIPPELRQDILFGLAGELK
jgi:hypothetical protein